MKKHYDYYEYDVYEVHEVYEKRTSKSTQNTYEFSYKDEEHHSGRAWSYRTAYSRRVETASGDKGLISA